MLLELLQAVHIVYLFIDSNWVVYDIEMSLSVVEGCGFCCHYIGPSLMIDLIIVFVNANF